MSLVAASASTRLPYKDNGMPVEEDAYLKGQSNEKEFAGGDKTCVTVLRL
jgi:hypothetical protein